MIPLSTAMIKGALLAPHYSKGFFTPSAGSDPLGAAYLGHLHPEAIEPFWQFVRYSTPDALCAHLLRGLHRTWPYLGASVRQWPSMADELERDRLIPRVVTNQPVYRREIHRSLWAVICDMHTAYEPKDRIAEFLGRHSL